jgi:hypothetical protein
MNTNEASKPGPSVKINPDFKAGETVIDQATGDELVIDAITKEGNLRIRGRAGLMPPSGVEKKL